MNQPYATLTLASALREMFGVQLYKNNARALLSRILSILNLDWLPHARSVRGVYELLVKPDLKLSNKGSHHKWGIYPNSKFTKRWHHKILIVLGSNPWWGITT